MSEDSERLDRLEHHFRLYKQDMLDIKDSVKEIKIRNKAIFFINMRIIYLQLYTFVT